MILFLYQVVQADLSCLWKPDSVSKIEHELVDVTPAPVFPRLEGLNDRMIGRYAGFVLLSKK